MKGKDVKVSSNSLISSFCPFRPAEVVKNFGSPIFGVQITICHTKNKIIKMNLPKQCCNVSMQRNLSFLLIAQQLEY